MPNEIKEKPAEKLAREYHPERRLRVGYVSPDFRRHAMALFIQPLIEAHDRRAVEIFCYAEGRIRDAITEHLQRLADRWLFTTGLSDDALAARIRADGIDILVDLAGHTAGNRLLTFARRPAPVQVTWLGYLNTTGLAAMDYRLVDWVTDPPGAEAFATEALLRLEGGFVCYRPADAPEPGEPPCTRTGAVTFGSFNNPAKLSVATLEAWASLLAQVPASRLLLKGGPFEEPATCASFLARSAERGVAPERVELDGWTAWGKHLAAYDRVDIGLDPFPYNGGATTCDALWMGVPVVTLSGDRHAGRFGASLLSQVGLPELVARSVEEYVALAAELASDRRRLADFRRSLRPRMAASSLRDEAGFARKIEAAYREMWRRWCAGGSVPSSGK